MVRTIPQDLLDELGKPDGQFPFVLFAELVVSTTTTAQEMFRFVRYPKELSFLGKTWYPFAFKVSAITAGSDGELPRLKLEVDDPAGAVRPWLHVANAFRGRTLKLYWTHWSTMGAGHYIEWEFSVVSADVLEDSVEFTLRWTNFFDEAFPHDTFVRGRCRWLQGSTECGDYRMQVNCGRTLEGCIAVGADWTAAGLSPLHPRRYSGYDSIPGQRR